MTEQLALTIAAASVGFVSAGFFCVGNVLNTAARITDQASPRWDFSEPVARALATQRAQYVVGALLLVVTFLLQVAAALASPTNHAALPQLLQCWPYFVLAVLSPTALFAGGCAALLYKATIRKVLRLVEERLKQEEQKRKNPGSA